MNIISPHAAAIAVNLFIYLPSSGQRPIISCQDENAA
jgi:hypothetical protein